jgi:transposase
MDSLDGGAVERTTRPVWLQERRASAAEPVGEDGGLAQVVAGLPRPAQRRQENSLERVLCRRHVHRGEKRGQGVGKTKRGKGTKLMVLADGAGTPLGVCVEKASPAEVKLLERTLDAVKVRQRRGPRRRPAQPQRLIADRGYDSNAARALLVKRAIEPIIPRRKNNRVATHQDGRKLRRYKRRWIIERTNSWLQNFRRLVVRYERSVKNFEALIHMACALMTLKKV